MKRTGQIAGWMAAMALAAGGCIPEAPKPGAGTKAAAPGTGAYDKAVPDLSDLGPDTDSAQLLAAVEQLKDQLREKPRDYNVNLALGNLFYDNARYIEAIQFFSDAEQIAAEARERLTALVTAGALPQSGAKAPESCVLDSSATSGQPRSLEAIVAEAKALDGTDAKAAVACWAQLQPTVSSLHARRGNSWYLIGNPRKAKEDHDAALGVDPNHAEALFFSGALLLEQARGDEKMLEEGQAYWKRLLEIAPDHSRAELVRRTLPRVRELFGRPPMAAGAMPAGHPPAAGGMPPGHPPADGGTATAAALPAVSAEMQQAMAAVERTPELEAQLDAKIVEGEKLLAEGKWQEALDAFRSVMPLRPSGPVALGLGIALRELGRPTAEMVLRQASQLPQADVPRARFELARLLEKTNVNEARAIYAELAKDAKWGEQARARAAALK